MPIREFEKVLYKIKKEHNDFHLIDATFYKETFILVFKNGNGEVIIYESDYKTWRDISDSNPVKSFLRNWWEALDD